MKINKGKITNFGGSWGSGLAFLEIDGVSVPCDNGATVRALDSYFDGFITPGHTVNPQAIIGQEIFWSWDDFGLTLGGFVPVESAQADIVDAFEAQTEVET